MGIVIRQSMLTSIISYVGVVIGYINLLYLYPKFLKPEEIGLLRSIQDAAMLFTPFAIFGLGQSIIRFYPYFSATKKQAGSFLNLIMILGVITYGIFLLFFLLLKEYFISFFDKNANNLIPHISLILILTFLLLSVTLLEQYCRSLLQVVFPAFVREVMIRIMQGVLVSFYFLHLISFDQFLVSSVLIYVIALIILVWYLLQQGHFNLNFQFHSNSGIRLQEIFKFSALSFIGTSAVILIGKTDSIMVSGMLGFASNAIYTTAFYMASVIEIPKRAITVTASPVIARAFEKNDLVDVGNLYRKTSINQFIIGSLLMIGVFANLNNIFLLMPNGEIYKTGFNVVLIIGCGKLIDMVFGPSSEIIGLSKHYWFNLVVISCLAGIVVIGNYFLIPGFGIEGAAYSSAIALVVYNALKFFFILAKLKVQPFSVNTLKVLLVGAAVTLINMALPVIANVYLDIIFRSTLITLLFGALILGTKSSPEINKLCSDMMIRINRKN